MVATLQVISLHSGAWELVKRMKYFGESLEKMATVCYALVSDLFQTYVVLMNGIYFFVTLVTISASLEKEILFYHEMIPDVNFFPSLVCLLTETSLGHASFLEIEISLYHEVIHDPVFCLVTWTLVYHGSFAEKF